VGRVAPSVRTLGSRQVSAQCERLDDDRSELTTSSGGPNPGPHVIPSAEYRWREQLGSSPAINLSLVLRLVVLLLPFGVTSAAAQSNRPLFVSSGVRAVSRDSSHQSSLQDDAADWRSNVPAVSVAVGKFMAPWFAVEGNVEFQGSQSFPWRYGYQFGGLSEQRLSHKDLPFVALGRFSLNARGRARVEPVIGMGFTRHSVKSLITADCGYGTVWTCVPMTPPVMGSKRVTWEWLTVTGIDVPIRLSSQFSMAPTVRLMYARRPPYLTPEGFRGPSNGSGSMTSVGITGTWRQR